MTQQEVEKEWGAVKAEIAQRKHHVLVEYNETRIRLANELNVIYSDNRSDKSVLAAKMDALILTKHELQRNGVTPYAPAMDGIMKQMSALQKQARERQDAFEKLVNGNKQRANIARDSYESAMLALNMELRARKEEIWAKINQNEA